MSRPLLLDLFCGQGGASMGYYQAGFDVIGVDHRPQPRYPFPVLVADALQCLVSLRLRNVALIHASPPCQRYSRAQPLQGRVHPDLVPAVREALRRTGRPYVIENVVGAPLEHPVLLCGLHFGLKVFRHRLFETDGFLLSMPHIAHGKRRIGVDGFCCPAGHGDSGRVGVPSECRRVDTWRKAMGIDWMTRDGLAQAVPPAYTRFIGQQMR